MNEHLILKDALRELRMFNDRVIVAGVLVLLLSGLLVARLFYLQVVAHQHFTTLSENNRQKILPLPPSRGLIYDRNGVVLAENQPSFSLELVPDRIDRPVDQLITELQGIISITPADVSRFKRFSRQKRRFEQVPLRLHLSEEEVARIAVRRHMFPGVYINASLERYYPLGEHASHAVGYVARISEQDLEFIDASNYSGTTHIGKIGVERSYEDELHGTVGLQRVETDVQGRVLRVLEAVSPVPGKNVYLNLDIALQKFAEQLLAGRRASLVALEPGSGAVLALVSTPMFDPNLFVNGIDYKTYEALNRSTDRPLYNRALRGQYPPGSTIKMLVGLAGLEYGVINSNHRVWCPGWYQLAGRDRKYRDWKKTGHGSVDFHHAVEQSCDVFFYDLAHSLEINRLSEFLQRFGLGHKTGIDIGGELGGLIPSREWKQQARGTAWYPGETLIVGIGQGFTLTTPLQLALAISTLSTRGHAREPRLAFAVDGDSAGQMRIVPSPTAARVSLSREDYWDQAISAMEAVVHGPQGTARAQSKGLQYRMAGKTGTAQVVGIKQDEKYDAKKLQENQWDHALFVAFAPVEAPRIALALIVENGGGGSSTAAPIARQVIDYYLLGPPAPVPANEHAN